MAQEGATSSRWRRRLTAAGRLWVIVCLAVCHAVAAQELSPGSFSAGGGVSSGGGLVLFGSFGQPLAGYSQGPSIVWGGFISAAFPPPPGIPRQIHLEADSASVVVDGSATVNLRAEIQDLRNNLVTTASDVLTFSVTSGSATLASPSSVAAVKGRASLAMTASSTGMVEVECTGAGLLPGSTTVYFTGPAKKLSVEANPKAIMADGNTKSLVRAAVVDANDYPVPGTPVEVTFTTTAGTLAGTNPVTTVDGAATIELRSSSVEEQATVTASADAAGLTAGTARVDFVIPVIDAFAADVRSPTTGRTVWDFDVQRFGEGDDEVTLTWSDLSAVPKRLRLTLVDTQTGARRYLRTTSGHRFRLATSATRRFQLVAEDSAASPLRITGIVARPARGGALVVSYQLTHEAEVTLHLRSPLGRVAVAGQSPSRSRAGTNTLTLVPGNLAKGAYLIVIIARTEDGQTAKGVGALALR